MRSSHLAALAPLLAVPLFVASFLQMGASGGGAAPAQAAKDDRRAQGYRLETGAHQVGEAGGLTLHDGERGVDVPVLVRFPKGHEGAAPLIVFSHGAGGASDAFAELSAHWASHGYVVVHPTHADSIKLRRSRGEDVSGELVDVSKLFRNVDPMGRLADLKLVLDSLDELERLVPAMRTVDGRPLVDRTKCVVAGHSAGALTAQIAIGAKVRTRQRLLPTSYAEERFSGAIIISGQGTTNRMFTDDSWAGIAKPMLVVTGSLDTVRQTPETPESRREPFEKASPGSKYLLWIEGATHASYAGKNSARLLGERPTTDIALITDAVASTTLAFLDAHTRAHDDAAAWLASDKVTDLTTGAAVLSRK